MRWATWIPVLVALVWLAWSTPSVSQSHHTHWKLAVLSGDSTATWPQNLEDLPLDVLLQIRPGEFVVLCPSVERLDPLLRERNLQWKLQEWNPPDREDRSVRVARMAAHVQRIDGAEAADDSFLTTWVAHTVYGSHLHTVSKPPSLHSWGRGVEHLHIAEITSHVLNSLVSHAVEEPSQLALARRVSLPASSAKPLRDVTILECPHCSVLRSMKLVGPHRMVLTVRLPARAPDMWERLLAALESLNFVLQVDLHPQFKLLNDRASAIVQHGVAQPDFFLWHKGLKGQGQIAGVGDSGLDFRSCFFDGPAATTPPKDTVDYSRRKVVAYNPYVDSLDTRNGHGTHVVGSIAGSCIDAEAWQNQFRGNAPESKIAFFDSFKEGQEFLGFPDDMYTDYFGWLRNTGARVLSNSWGSQTSPNDNKYSSFEAEVDAYIFDHPDTLIIFANGNEGLSGSMSVGRPALAKNVLSVGASVNGFSSSAQEADFGPSMSTIGPIRAAAIQALPRDACSALTNVLSGKVALVERGSCPFVDKIRNCQLAGAIAVLVFNNQEEVITMHGEAPDVTIPSMLLPFYVSEDLRYIVEELAVNQEPEVELLPGAMILISPVIGVQDLAYFSSVGPTADHRIKPDVVAPGAEVFSASSGSPCEVHGKQGTSMATPITSGLALLLRQYFVEGWYPTGEKNPADAWLPSAALLKATLVHSGQQMDGYRYDQGTEMWVPMEEFPSSHQGFGLVDASSTLYFRGSTPFRSFFALDGWTLNSDRPQLPIVVTAFGTGRFKVTLVWTDAPGTPGAASALVYSLQFYLEDESGNRIYGNSMAPGATQSPDVHNNVQIIFYDLSVGVPSTKFKVVVDRGNAAENFNKFAVVMTSPDRMLTQWADLIVDGPALVPWTTGDVVNFNLHTLLSCSPPPQDHFVRVVLKNANPDLLGTQGEVELFRKVQPLQEEKDVTFSWTLGALLPSSQEYFLQVEWYPSPAEPIVLWGSPQHFSIESSDPLPSADFLTPPPGVSVQRGDLLTLRWHFNQTVHLLLDLWLIQANSSDSVNKVVDIATSLEPDVRLFHWQLPCWLEPAEYRVILVTRDPLSAPSILGQSEVFTSLEEGKPGVCEHDPDPEHPPHHNGTCSRGSIQWTGVWASSSIGPFSAGTSVELFWEARGIAIQSHLLIYLSRASCSTSDSGPCGTRFIAREVPALWGHFLWPIPNDLAGPGFSLHMVTVPLGLTNQTASFEILSAPPPDCPNICGDNDSGRCVHGICQCKGLRFGEACDKAIPLWGFAPSGQELRIPLSAIKAGSDNNFLVAVDLSMMVHSPGIPSSKLLVRQDAVTRTLKLLSASIECQGQDGPVSCSPTGSFEVTVLPTLQDYLVDHPSLLRSSWNPSNPSPRTVFDTTGLTGLLVLHVTSLFEGGVLHSAELVLKEDSPSLEYGSVHWMPVLPTGGAGVQAGEQHLVSWAYKGPLNTLLVAVVLRQRHVDGQQTVAAAVSLGEESLLWSVDRTMSGSGFSLCLKNPIAPLLEQCTDPFDILEARCPRDCSGPAFGKCSQGSCVCNSGYSGADCSKKVPVSVVTPGDDGVPTSVAQSGTVSAEEPFLVGLVRDSVSRSASLRASATDPMVLVVVVQTNPPLIEGESLDASILLNEQGGMILSTAPVTLQSYRLFFEERMDETYVVRISSSLPAPRNVTVTVDSIQSPEGASASGGSSCGALCVFSFTFGGVCLLGTILVLIFCILRRCGCKCSGSKTQDPTKHRKLDHPLE